MTDIVVRKIDETWIHVSSKDQGIEMEIFDSFKFEVPGAKYMPLYKQGLWDGLVKAYNYRTKRMHLGLFEKISDFAKENDYSISFQNEIVEEDFDHDYLINWIKKQEVTDVNGNLLIAHEYQKSVVVDVLLKKRRLILSPTSSGKSLIIYFVMKFMVEHDLKLLILVPTTSLVSQLFTDFRSYSQKNNFDCSQIQQLYSGLSKDLICPVLISTWQTVHSGTKKSKKTNSTSFEPEWFNQFDGLICDEAHLAAAASLTSIFEKANEVSLKCGLTGTLSGAKSGEIVLVGLIGPVIKTTTTRELIDEGKISDVKIKCLCLKHPKSHCKALKGKDYFEEIDWLISNPKRNRFLAKLALSRKGNTLILFTLVEKHGKILFKLMNDIDSNKKIYFIHGKTEVEEREEVRAIAEAEDDIIICASYGVFSTGINIKRLHNIIFAAPTKSRIRTLQSLGRGLRIGDGKEICELFDIGDDLTVSGKKNFTLRHMLERVKYYAEDQLDYKIINVELGE